MARPRVSGSTSSMMIINAWAKVEKSAIAVPRGESNSAAPRA
jgi:hypothetical protein